MEPSVAMALGLRKGTQEMSRMNTKSLASSALTVVAFNFCMVLVMRPTVVSGASMMPTLHDKDVLIASQLAKRLLQLTRGDIVTVCLSADPLCGFVFSGDTQYVKRIVAVPGDVVRYGACNIFVTASTGRKVEDTEPTMACHDRGEFKQIVLPEGMYFVAGDNRGNSLDSRIFGPVSKSQIHAKVLAQMRLTWAP
jgi:signal peptidase I